jgi:hypothetical protein
MPTTVTRPLARLVPFALVAVAASVTLAPAASAAARRGPSCARVEHSSGIVTQTVKVTNNCRSTISFSVRRVGQNSPCYIVRPGHWRTYKWANGLNYQGITWNCS